MIGKGFKSMAMEPAASVCIFTLVRGEQKIKRNTQRRKSHTHSRASRAHTRIFQTRVLQSILTSTSRHAKKAAVQSLMRPGYTSLRRRHIDLQTGMQLPFKPKIPKHSKSDLLMSTFSKQHTKGRGQEHQSTNSFVGTLSSSASPY